MEYKLLTAEYQEDAVVDAMLGREMEHFHYQLNEDNYKEILKTEPEGPYRDRIQALLASNTTEKAKVESVYAALEKQAPQGAAFDVVAERVKAKRSAAEEAATVEAATR